MTTLSKRFNRGTISRMVKQLFDGDYDYTSGSMVYAIILLSIPMVLEMSMESVFAVVDVFFVGKLGPAAVATIGLTESLLTMVFAIAIGLSMATTAMVSRRIGEKNPEGARVAAMQAIALGILISLPIAIVGIFFAPDLLRLMGASADVIEQGSTYTAIMIGGNAVIMMLFLINAIFRGAGDPLTSMTSLTFANMINIILDPCLIFGLGPFPELGLTGAAVATTIGRGLGVAFQCFVLFRGRGALHLPPRHFAIHWQVMRRLMRLSIGGILQWTIATASWVALTRVVAIFGEQALAGYTIGIRIIVFAILPSWGMSNAAATLVGQNLGAKQPERAERSVMLACIYNMVFLGSIAVVFLIFAPQLVGIFTDEPEVLGYGIQCLRYISYGYVFFAVGMVVTQAFNGAGDTTTPTFINFFCYWLFQIPLVYLLAISWDMGPTGVFVGIAIAESALAVVGYLAFRRGTWKTRQV